MEMTSEPKLKMSTRDFTTMRRNQAMDIDDIELGYCPQNREQTIKCAAPALFVKSNYLISISLNCKHPQEVM